MSETAPFVATVTDSAGRVLVIKKLSILQELDLIEAAGANSDNGRWMMMATLACCVTDINGAPMPTPTNRQQIRNRVSLVGSHGVAAVVAALNAQDPAEPEDGEATPSVDTAKN